MMTATTDLLIKSWPFIRAYLPDAITNCDAVMAIIPRQYSCSRDNDSLIRPILARL